MNGDGLSAPHALTEGEWKLQGCVRVWVTADRPSLLTPLTVKARLRGYNQWRRGLRNDFTRQAYREYLRFYQRAATDGEDVAS
ncbi:MAG TPA: hypothetical protein VHW64_19305 [Nocardioides sp.]|jgi:hypothetical protein|uniref:hypothetical protein n=1 Tax=Nocardioides sp. TaxID=35761 RepID=UPI002E37CF5A|nr:hypothetical protein [Nocardioides sp.]HEX3932847.1 hypothetical protein [Nocardioides sp.]